MPSLAFVALVVAIGLLVLIPTRRLFIAGWSGRALGAYFFGMVALGVLVAELRAPARFLIPLLVVAYIAPFVTAREGIRRLFGRSRREAPPIVRPSPRPSLPEPPEVVPPDDADAAAARPVGARTGRDEDARGPADEDGGTPTDEDGGTRS